VKKLIKYIDDVLIYTALFWIVGVGCLISSILNNTYDGANFYGGIICLSVTSAIIWWFYIRKIMSDKKMN
jgi:hypothetical protein